MSIIKKLTIHIYCTTFSECFFLYRFPDCIGTLPDGSETDILAIFVNTGFVYRLPANLSEIKSEEVTEKLIMAYPAKLPEGNYYRRCK